MLASFPVSMLIRSLPIWKLDQFRLDPSRSSRLRRPGAAGCLRGRALSSRAGCFTAGCASGCACRPARSACAVGWWTVRALLPPARCRFRVSPCPAGPCLVACPPPSVAVVRRWWLSHLPVRLSCVRCSLRQVEISAARRTLRDLLGRGLVGAPSHCASAPACVVTSARCVRRLFCAPRAVALRGAPTCPASARGRAAFRCVGAVAGPSAAVRGPPPAARAATSGSSCVVFAACGCFAPPLSRSPRRAVCRRPVAVVPPRARSPLPSAKADRPIEAN